jgi:hypothetical protein
MGDGKWQMAKVKRQKGRERRGKAINETDIFCKDLFSNDSYCMQILNNL